MGKGERNLRCSRTCKCNIDRREGGVLESPCKAIDFWISGLRFLYGEVAS